MIKRMLMVAALAVTGLCIVSEKSDAGVFYRPIAPVRRVAARAVLPPYPVAHRVYAPVYRPVVAPAVRPVYGPVLYGSPYMASPYGYGGVSVVVGF